MHRISFLVASLLFCFPCANSRAEIPKRPVGYVSDFANILDPRTESELNSLVAQTEQKTSAEIAVVTISSLDGMSVEEFAHKLFNRWGIGKKGKDNGVLVLIAARDRKMRIEVGYGLEPVLPDGLCGEIIREQFTPAFKSGNFPQGVKSGVTRIAEIILKGEPAKSSKKSPGTSIAGLFFITLTASVFSLVAGGCWGAKVISDMLIALSVTVMMLIAPKTLSSLWGWIITLPITVSAFIWGLKLGKEDPYSFRETRRRGLQWIWSDTGKGDGFFGGFSGFMGAFSGGAGGGGFGGGSSGGGGASGSW